jgi:hypothetical protein
MVNSIADYFQIGLLVQLSNKKTQQMGGLSYEGKEATMLKPLIHRDIAQQLPDALNRALESLCDDKVRTILTSMASANLTHLVADDEIKRIDALSELAPLLIKDCNQKVEAHLAKIAALQAKITQYMERLVAVQQRVKNEKHFADTIKGFMRASWKCHNPICTGSNLYEFKDGIMFQYCYCRKEVKKSGPLEVLNG